MSVSDLLAMISKGLKNPIVKEDIFSDEINLSHLKRIDKVFNKGLHFYLDPKAPEVSKDASIFFRKEKFDLDLNMGAKKIVNQFEEFKISLSAIAKLAELNIERKLPVFSVRDNPKLVSKQIRKELYPEFTTDKKEFLKSLIKKFAECNILVFEFVETWNKKEKANIDGFFLNPNVIVLKRNQNSFRREIFTLIHELGHFLLNEEEVEQLDYQNLAKTNLSAVEKWCNDFAYYFLAGDYDNAIEKIEAANETNDYHFDIIEKVSNKTHLSQIALFTKLLFQNKISKSNYYTIKEDFDERFKTREVELIKQRLLDKQNGIKTGGSVPKPINSPLLISTIQTAFYEGVINEYEVCKRLNIKPDKLEKYIQ
jgi:Zn-dependent peptidase ImmA (M78 family)